MGASERDEAPMLPPSNSESDNGEGSTRRGLSWRTRSVSMSFATNSPHPPEYEQNLVGLTGPLRSAKRNQHAQISDPLQPNHKNEFMFRPPRMATEPENLANGNEEGYGDRNEHLLRSGQLGMCNDPSCTTCPSFYDANGKQKSSRTTEIFDAEFRHMLHGNPQGWAKRRCSFLLSYIPGVMNPHARHVQRWIKFFVISCAFAAFLDPLFFLLLFVRKEQKCIALSWPKTKAFVILRSITDLIYLLHILLQFRLAYVAPQTRILIVNNPKEIARNYFFTYFFLDLLVVLPLPQIIIYILSRAEGSPQFIKYILPSAILLQYIPRLCRFLPLVAGFSPTGFIFESAWANFLMNLLTYVLASHVVGSCWYLLSIQRIRRCFEEACNSRTCMPFIYCRNGFEDDRWEDWKNNSNANACFSKEGFEFGICEAAVNLTTHNVFIRYVYSLFWGFQQISTLAGNQEPSYLPAEIFFTMFIIGIGLMLFALLIGNMQNFLQALGRRRLDLTLRRRDVEQWMSHSHLPKDLRRRVQALERFNWAGTRGVNEDMLMENWPEDLQREIRRHLFKFLNKVRIFQLLDEPIIDAIREKLKTKTYISGSNIMTLGSLVDKMVFIIRGTMVSTGEDGICSTLSEGDVCGEEVLTWCFERSTINKDGKQIRLPGPLSNRQVTCSTNVEVFVLRGVDIEEVTSLFARFLRSPRIQGAIRYISPYWRGLAARRIQVAWKDRQKRVNRADHSSPRLN